MNLVYIKKPDEPLSRVEVHVLGLMENGYWFIPSSDAKWLDVTSTDLEAKGLCTRRASNKYHDGRFYCSLTRRGQAALHAIRGVEPDAQPHEQRSHDPVS
jgi:hypothetical protein